jgi:hypothetical protein
VNASTIIKLIIGLVATAVWGAALVGKHFWPDLDTSAIVLACGSALTGLGIYHVASPDGAADKPADKQAGRANPALLGLLAVALLAGCSTVMRGYESAAYNEIKSADDNTLAVLKVAFCGQPLSAFLRNAELIPGAKALCLPGGNASNPADLLDAGRVPITINLTVPMAAAPASAPK